MVAYTMCIFMSTPRVLWPASKPVVSQIGDTVISSDFLSPFSPLAGRRLVGNGGEFLLSSILFLFSGKVFFLVVWSRVPLVSSCWSFCEPLALSSTLVRI